MEKENMSFVMDQAWAEKLQAQALSIGCSRSDIIRAAIIHGYDDALLHLRKAYLLPAATEEVVQ